MVIHQTESERDGVEGEAKVSIDGFISVEDPTHGQTLGSQRHNQAVINLEGGQECTVRFEHETTKRSVRWGADVTDWGDCPLKKDD